MKGGNKMKRSILVWVTILVISVFCVANLGAAEKRVVKIAFLGPLSGGVAQAGMAARNAYDLAINQANASGKLNFVIEELVLDDESNPATGVAAALKAVSDPQVVAATGHHSSPVGSATIHIFHNHQVPLVLWGTIHPDITNKYNYPEVTRVMPTLDTQSRMGAEFVVSKLGYKNWSIIHDTNDFGVSSKDIFSRHVESLGGRVFSIDGVTTGTTDYRPVLTKIKALKEVKAIYVGTAMMEGALVRDQMLKLGMGNMIMMGNTGIYGETFNKVAGPAAEGTLSTGAGNPNNSEKGRKLIEDYKKAGYKETFDELVSPSAYDSTNIIIEALKKVGPDDTVALAKEIRSTKYNGAFGQTEFDDFGQTKLGGILVYVSQDGKWVVWDGSDYAAGKKKLPK
jgi:branched-chain amino acid transport system substrate-binding protein